MSARFQLRKWLPGGGTIGELYVVDTHEQNRVVKTYRDYAKAIDDCKAWNASPPPPIEHFRPVAVRSERLSNGELHFTPVPRRGYMGDTTNTPFGPHDR